MKKRLKKLLCLLMILGMIIPMTTLDVSAAGLLKESDNGYYEYNATAAGHYSNRSDVITPAYYIFAGKQSLDQANQLIEDLGMIDNVNEWGSTISVITPSDDGDVYTANDLEAFETVIKSAPIKNVKIIGIDEGANFVKTQMKAKMNYVAGVLLIGGDDMTSPTGDSVAVPAYLSNAGSNTEAYFKNTNKTTYATADASQYTVYQNDSNPLQAVAVASSTTETKAEAFANAWESIFSKNNRYHNSLTEFYNMMKLNGTTDYLTFDFDLTSITDYEALGIQYNVKKQQTVAGLPGSNYLWFEYIPESVLNSADDSVPLVISLHGNTNDPRLQGDTTGWPELAAQEGFMYIAPEYQKSPNRRETAYFRQGTNANIYGVVDGLAESEGLENGDGVVELINELKTRYPEIDMSRVYVTGLSLGGNTANLIGAKHNDVFAAVAPVSGVNRSGGELTSLVENYDGYAVPYLYICGDHDEFQMIPVGKGESLSLTPNAAQNITSALQAYQKMNGLEQSSFDDFSKNPYYGVQLENQHWSKLGTKNMLEGYLTNDEGQVMMQLAAIENQAHWNYKPQAEYIWNFFKNYTRTTSSQEDPGTQPGGNINDNQGAQAGQNGTNDNKQNQPKTSVKTGDSTNPTLYFMMTISSFAGVYLVLKKKFNY